MRRHKINMLTVSSTKDQQRNQLNTKRTHEFGSFLPPTCTSCTALSPNGSGMNPRFVDREPFVTGLCVNWRVSRIRWFVICHIGNIPWHGEYVSFCSRLRLTANPSSDVNLRSGDRFQAEVAGDMRQRSCLSESCQAFATSQTTY